MSTFNTIDALHNETEIQVYKKIVNLLMQKGKRTKALKILYKTLLTLKKNIYSIKKLTKNKSFVFQAIRTKKINQAQVKHLGFQSLSSKNQLQTSSKELRSNWTPNKLTLQNDLLYNQAEHLLIFHKAIENVLPFLEVRKARSKGTTRQIPTMIKTSRQQTLAVRWLIEGAHKHKKQGNNFYDCLALELMDALQKQGTARQKRNDLHKAAHANRANLRYRWW